MAVTRTTLDPSEVGKTCLKWNETRYPICWSDNPYTWNDVCLIFELISGGGPDDDVLERYEEWEGYFWR